MAASGTGSKSQNSEPVNGSNLVDLLIECLSFLSCLTFFVVVVEILTTVRPLNCKARFQPQTIHQNHCPRWNRESSQFCFYMTGGLRAHTFGMNGSRRMNK